MPLDPSVARFLQATAEADPEPALSLEEQRSRAEQTNLAQAGEAEAVALIENRLISGPAGALPIRIYTPAVAEDEPLPVLLYFHGGGWVFGSIAALEPVCCALANHAHCLVVSVAYRLAPEHPFPAAPEDCYTATCWVAEHAHEINADPARIAVGGESAGGNLAAVVALMARDRQGPALCFQLLIYGETDYYRPGTASYITYSTGYGLTREEMIWFWDHYLSRPEDRVNPYAVPFQATDLSGLAPALIITAEYDPVRDEAEHYARRLQQADVPVQLSRYTGMIHGFFRMFALFTQSHQALAEVADTLQRAFALTEKSS